METIEVVEGGLFTSVQDLGRYGYQRYGVPVSGAMDPYSLRLANILLGNPEGAAALEITLVGPKLKFLANTTIALGGADLAPRLNGSPVPPWQSFRVAKGSLLTFDGPRSGVKSYLAVPGGIDVPVVMGSRSTYSQGSLGGHEGRSLKPGDRISVLRKDAGSYPNSATIPRSLVPGREHDFRIRVVMGPQADAFTPEGIAVFFSSTYTVSQKSNRIGYRLQGPAVDHLKSADIISDGVTFGAVQITGDGLPVVLMADRGTTGGYTKIGAVISVDIGELAQTLPGDHITFQAVSVEEAHRLLSEREEALEKFKGHVTQTVATKNSGLRILVNGQAFEVQDEDHANIAQKEPLAGDVHTYRRIITATVNDRSYTFEVEVQDPA